MVVLETEEFKCFKNSLEDFHWEQKQNQKVGSVDLGLNFFWDEATI